MSSSGPPPPGGNDASGGALPAREPRQRVLFGGKIFMDNGFSSDCTIRNMSAGGAQIMVPPGTLLPDAFYLIEIRSGAAYRAEVVWRAPPKAGVRFKVKVDLSHPDRSQDPRLRQLWLACAARGAEPSEG